MDYRTAYLKGNSVEDLCSNMDAWFETAVKVEPGLKVDNIAYMQEMKVQRLNPQIPMVEFCCIVTYTP